MGYVLFSDRLGGTAKPFNQTGTFYFAPGANDGLTNDANATQTGYQGQINVVVRVDGVARTVPIIIRGGYASDGPLAVSQSSSTLNSARLQQRLRFLGFPDSSGTPLVVDGIIGPLSRAAISLFNAAVSKTNVGNDVQLNAQGAAFINATNVPRWNTLGSPLVNGDFAVASGAPVFGTDWATEIVRISARSARASGMPSTVAVTVNRVSATSGGPLAGITDGHQAGLDIDIAIPTNVRAASTGTVLNAAEQQWVKLLIALATSSSRGARVSQMRMANAKLAAAVNEAVGRNIATVDANATAELSVSLGVPVPTRPLTSTQKTQLVDGLEQAAGRLDSLRTVGQPSKPLPGLTTTDATPQPVTAGDVFEIGNLIKNTLVNPLRNLFSSSGVLTQSDVMEAIKSFQGQAGSLNSQVLPDSVDVNPSGNNGQTAFRVKFTGQGTRNLRIDLGAASQGSVNLSAGADVALAAEFTCDLTFGIGGKRILYPGK